MSDPAKYRGKGELEAFRSADPLERVRRALLELHGFTEQQLEQIDDGIVAEMDAASKFADESPQPDPEHRFANIMIEEQPGEREASPHAGHRPSTGDFPGRDNQEQA